MTLEGIELRAARWDDNDALLHLTRQCPMQADISLLIEREPSFFALARARGRSWTLVAEVEGELAGCVSVARRAANVNGSRREMGVLADVKVAPSHRAHGLAQRMLDRVYECEREQPPAVFVGLTAAGNRRVDTMVQHFGERLPLRALGTFEACELIPLMPLPVPAAYTIRPATPGDLEELANLLERFHRPLCFSPIFTERGLEEQLARSPGMELSSYLLAERHGVIEAALGVWDQRAFKRTRVMGMPGTTRAVIGLGRAVARLGCFPALPTVGEYLCHTHLRHAAHAPGREEALVALVRHAVNRARARHDHFATMAFAANSSLRGLVRGIPRLTYRYRLVAGCNRREAQSMLEGLESLPLYDDASLS